MTWLTLNTAGPEHYSILVVAHGKVKYHQSLGRFIYKVHCIDRLILATLILDRQMSSFPRMQKDRLMSDLGEKNFLFTLE